MVNIENLYEKILMLLKEYRCDYTLTDEGGACLVDLLTPPDDNDIKNGIDELEKLAEYLTCRLDDLSHEAKSL